MDINVQDLWLSISHSQYFFLLPTFIGAVILRFWFRLQLRKSKLQANTQDGIDWEHLLSLLATLWFVLLIIAFGYPKDSGYNFEKVLETLNTILLAFTPATIFMVASAHYRNRIFNNENDLQKLEVLQQEVYGPTSFLYLLAALSLTSLISIFWVVVTCIILFIWHYRQERYRGKINNLFASFQSGHQLRYKYKLHYGYSFSLGEKEITILGPVGLSSTLVEDGGERKYLPNEELLLLLPLPVEPTT